MQENTFIDLTEDELSNINGGGLIPPIILSPFTIWFQNEVNDFFSGFGAGFSKPQ